MFDPARHVPLRQLAWNETTVREAIGEIVADALAHFDPERFWPAHPQEDGVPDGDASFYFGATGVIWALEYLRRIGATQTDFDFRPLLSHLVAVNKQQFTQGPSRDYAGHGSFLFGDMGTALLVW